MDKQQAAEKYATDHYGVLKEDIDRIGWHTCYKQHMAGWEAHEAQCQSPTDAVAFLHWLGDFQDLQDKDTLTYIDGEWFWHSDTEGNQPMTEEQLYAIFKKANPSGEAPQARDRFIQGYACAVANLCRLNGEADTRTYELFRDGLGKMANLEEAGVDESDMEILKKYFK